MFREDTIITQCQDEFRYHSGCVEKILTASRMLQISIARCQIELKQNSPTTARNNAWFVQ